MDLNTYKRLGAVIVCLLMIGFWNPIQGLDLLNERQQWIFLKAANTEPCNIRMWRITNYWDGGWTNGRAIGTYGYIYNAAGWDDDELWCLVRHECREEQQGITHGWEYLWNECWEEGWYE